MRAVTGALLGVIALSASADAWLVRAQRTALDDAARARAAQAAEARVLDRVADVTDSTCAALQTAILERRAASDLHVHLTVLVRSRLVRLERAGALLREMPARIAPSDVHAGTAAPHRLVGVRTVVAVADPLRIQLDSGMVVYATPGPLADSASVEPSGIRVAARDLRAMSPVLRLHATVYLLDR